MTTGCIAKRQPSVRIPIPNLNDAESVKGLWLRQTCDTNQEGQLEAQLVRFQVELEPLFIRAFQDDVAAADLDAVGEAATRQFREAKGGNASESQLKAHVTRERNNFVSGYKSAALAGLGIVGGAGGRRLLAQVAADPQSPFRHNAQLAMRSLPAKGKPKAARP
jgi:hypothetical protein